ncbi:hypothetical protein [Streptomyces montanisoli]|uniref:Integral membrane protein n=1 Tax=Streptomyces montanisoli TaxID=2798581 RepID=A0A940MDL2_9ACTN|nr:hypothetical protein [Streptomyces montanisoli]MBP0461084.1 hypothetical protein [Streptomyces montanisoli]
MQDRRSTVLRLPQHAGPVLLRERQSSSSTGPSDSSGSSGSGSGSGSGTSGGSGSGSASSGGSGSGSGSSGGSGSGSGSDDNPFAPPPEGSPDQPWSPRHRPQGGSEGGEEHGGGREGDERPVWGGQWSGSQPGRSGDGFGGRTGGQGPYGPDPRQGQGGGPGGPGGPGGGRGMRWDPTDVYQRRARYALLAGMWAFFFSLFSIPEVALLLGVLAIYWAISSLRAKNRGNGAAGEGAGPAGAGSTAARRPDPFAPPPHQEAYPSTSDRAYASAGVHHPPPSPEEQARPQHTVAISGLVAAGLALLIVASTYSMQFVYSDYYTCVHDALTHEGQVACNSHLPKSLVPFLGLSD